MKNKLIATKQMKHKYINRISSHPKTDNKTNQVVFQVTYKMDKTFISLKLKKQVKILRVLIKKVENRILNSMRERANATFHVYSFLGIVNLEKYLRKTLKLLEEGEKCNIKR